MKKHPQHRRHMTVLQRTYLHHIAWGVLCLTLLGAFLGVWTANQKLISQTNNLKTQVAALSNTRSSCHSRDTWQPGTLQTFSIDFDEGKRDFAVHLPKDFSPDQYYPALMYFGGKGGDMNAAINAPGVSELPAVTIFPEPTIGKDNTFAWQGAPYSSGADDIAFVGQILDKVQGQLCIDRSRIYAAGWSNGGGMVALLSCRMSDRFAAYGMVAGALYYPTSDCAPTRPTPIISIHGDSDTTVPYDGSLARQLPNIDLWSAHRAGMNSCGNRPFISNSNPNSTVTTWKSCQKNAIVEHIRIHGAGHSFNESMPKTMWQFMSHHSL